MTLPQLLEHWQLNENPFRGEEARHDSVFTRMAGEPEARTTHSDFEKVLGDLDRPAASILFGEKGSGKTAIRLQIAEAIRRRNQRDPQSKVLFVPYDDLNAIFDAYRAHVPAKEHAEAFAKFRLNDHIDAILSIITPRVVDAVLKDGPAPLDLGPDPHKAARKFDPSLKRDLLVLQAIYDRPSEADTRSRRLRVRLRHPLPARIVVWSALATLGWIPAALLALWVAVVAPESLRGEWLWYAVAVLTLAWLVVLAKVVGWDGLAIRRSARRIRKQVRVINRSDSSYARSIRRLDPQANTPAHLPMTESDETRYAAFARLRRALNALGYTGMIVVMDRVDEPTLVSGDPRIMQSVVWPLLNNKFLQQEGLGVKLLLPIELRHALFKESSAFFQEARLDKQNLVERLTWTGASLFDLCEARLRSCRAPGAEPIALLDLFAQDVTRQDLVDALDHMHQPRDAFKFLYRCMSEHCSNVTAEQGEFRIPRLVVESVKKQEADRVQQLYRGIRPA